MEIGIHIKRARKQKGLSQTALAQNCGWESQTRISNYENDSREPSLDDLKILSSALETTISNLIGEGSQEAGYVTLERLDVSASAGHGATPTNQEVINHVDVLERWAFSTLGTSDPNRIKIINVRGDSMYPKINDGDIAFVDITTKEFDAPGIYVILWNEMLLIKRLRPMMDGRLAIESENNAVYPPEYIEKDQLNSLVITGRVKAWWSLKTG